MWYLRTHCNFCIKISWRLPNLGRYFISGRNFIETGKIYVVRMYFLQWYFANSRPSASNFKSFSRLLEQFFLTVSQNNFGNKIPFSFHHHFTSPNPKFTVMHNFGYELWWWEKILKPLLKIQKFRSEFSRIPEKLLAIKKNLLRSIYSNSERSEQVLVTFKQSLHCDRS